MREYLIRNILNKLIQEEGGSLILKTVASTILGYFFLPLFVVTPRRITRLFHRLFGSSWCIQFGSTRAIFLASPEYLHQFYKLKNEVSLDPLEKFADNYWGLQSSDRSSETINAASKDFLIPYMARCIPSYSNGEFRETVSQYVHDSKSDDLTSWIDLIVAKVNVHYFCGPQFVQKTSHVIIDHMSDLMKSPMALAGRPSAHMRLRQQSTIEHITAIVDDTNYAMRDAFSNPHDSVAFLASAFLAAHDNTQKTLISLIVELYRHPQWLERCREEADRNRYSTAVSAKMYPVMYSCIIETMRRHAFTLFPMRFVETDFDLGPLKLKSGDLLLVLPELVANDTASITNPTEWIPDRDRSLTKDYFPFGAGHFSCPGRLFSINEILVVLKTLLLEYEIEFETSLEKVNIRPAPFGMSMVATKVAISSRKKFNAVGFEDGQTVSAKTA